MLVSRQPPVAAQRLHLPTMESGTMNSARPTPPGTSRFRLRVALLVALGVFAQESVWNFHDAQTPATLAQYTTSTALIGLVMGLDNILGIFVQPFMGHAS